ncbi:lantibiotic dehydratase [Streptomonospora wellingtoniae]|uniref:Lantibiotic dehydratase n=1 Tax=Streptomonospora wellingtoniae TaxID=3075544 RepID=A0ABU2L059_9ACTN|nr:lantibiotic dehydratase [Streptomonospora sp. DSM 45055]MDT0304940.1 lantibiotic dehydratase [Streptomonospora sp. DSM 45055]
MSRDTVDRELPAALEQPPALPSGARVASPPVVRTAGLPVRALGALRFTRSFAAVDEAARLGERVEAEGRLLAESLYDVIGTLGSGPPKPGVVGLRRALHRSRPPRAAEWNEQVAGVIPGPVADRIRRWTADLDALKRAVRELPAVLAAEEAAKRGELRAVAEHTGLRRALSQSSPALYAEVRKWLGDEAHPPRRQSLVALAKYVARASAKTSPYSTFMVGGVGVWTPDGPAVRDIGARRVRSVVELDGLLVQTLLASLCTDPRLAPSLRLRLNPSATVRDGRVSFAGRRPAEPVLAMPATPAVSACMDLLDTRPEPTWSALRDALVAAGRGASGRASADSVDSFLGGLVDLGLVERLSPVSDLAGDPLGELADWLSSCGGERPAGVLALVERVRTEARRDVPVTDLDGHHERQRRLMGAIGDLAARVEGLSETGGEAGPEADAEAEADPAASKWTFYENAVYTEPAAACSFARWEPALHDLDVLRTWLAPFDPSLPLRLALAAYFRERFGTAARVPVLTLHRAVQDELRREGAPEQTPAARELVRLLRAKANLVRPLAGSLLPRLRELSRIQAEARDAVLGDPGTGAAAQRGTVHADPARLAALSARWPPWVAAAESLACYVQPAGTGNAPSLVLNAVQNGHGRGRTRVLHLLDQAGCAAGEPASAPPEPGGRAVAELGGRFASSVNVRSAAAPYELDYPFTTSRRPAEQRIRPGDCVAVHDSRTGLVRLRCEPLDAEVLPLHLGMLGDLFLPAAAQFLTQCFGHSFYSYPSASLVADEAPRTPASVTAYPRVAVGSVVLRRAAWAAPMQRVPRRQGGETETDYWLRLLRWLREHGLPTRCFVRVWADPARPGSGASTERTWMLDKAHKPVYVDFANWYLVLAFQRMLDGSAAMAVFEEALPDPGEARTTGGGAVTEFLVEISEPGRRNG